MPKAKPDMKLIPLDELKKAVQGLLHVLKDDIDQAEAERPKRKRKKNST